VALTIADYVAACLTGVMATDPTQAASWGLFDLAAGQWDWDGVQRLGVPVAVLPPIRPSVSALGDLQSEIARSLGLPPKVTVYVPVGDNQASVAGAAGLARDTAVVNLGTGGQISVPQSEVIWVEGFETRPMLRGGPILVGASLCGGWSYAYLRRFYQEVVREFAGVELTDAHLYERMNRMAAEAAPATAGLSVDATFHGTRANPSHRGSVSGISASNLTVSNLTRAFVEGMVQELADMFRRVDHAGIRRVVASGNAVRENRAVVDVIASLFGRECYVSPHQEEAAHGAACAAAKQP
jgi:sugar (pentulose or hexulose) kinase